MYKMERYDYQSAIADDVRQWIIEHEDEVHDFESSNSYPMLHDWIYKQACNDDAVTGDASGSYTFNAYKANEYLFGNLDILADAFREFGFDGGEICKFLESSESCDVLIRTFLLYNVIGDVLDEIREARGERIDSNASLFESTADVFKPNK